jgi:hypothetical protein
MDYYAHAPQTAGMLERLAKEAPTTLACMHECVERRWGEVAKGVGWGVECRGGASVGVRRSRAKPG